MKAANKRLLWNIILATVIGRYLNRALDAEEKKKK